MKTITNHPIPGRHGRPIVLDLHFNETGNAKPLVVFVHGYKGFKDWGMFGAMAWEFVNAGFAFMKFNFSHNGGTATEPVDFPDLEAFGNNNYSIELDDLGAVLDWVVAEESLHAEIDRKRIGLIGHSRGGALSLLTAAADSRIRQLVTWAAVSSLDRTMFNEGPELEKWKRDGVLFVRNGRTQQDMPHYLQFYQDFIQNRDRFDVERAARQLNIPQLIIHGSGDDSVPYSHAEALHAWNASSALLGIPEADHVFGGKHPWQRESFPLDFQQVLRATLDFFQSNGL